MEGSAKGCLAIMLRRLRRCGAVACRWCFRQAHKHKACRQEVLNHDYLLPQISRDRPRGFSLNPSATANAQSTTVPTSRPSQVDP